MAEVAFPNVQLTVEQVRARLQANLPSGYTLVGKKAFFTDFTVRRSAGVGVGVKVKTDAKGTVVKLFGFAPSFWLRMVKGFVLAIFLGRKWARMEKEVAGWLTSKPLSNPRSATASKARAK